MIQSTADKFCSSITETDIHYYQQIHYLNYQLGSANPNPNPYLTSAAIVPDFNGDGKTDKLWVNAQTGEILVRLMNGTQVLEQASLGKYDLNTWDYKTADFNSDNKTDFLLRNKPTGDNVIVLMDGAKVSSYLTLDRVDPGWTANIGDFNGDRKTDIFWNNATTGENAIWQMDGTKVVSATVLETTAPGLTATIVDFDGNGKSDIFWRNHHHRRKYRLVYGW